MKIVRSSVLLALIVSACGPEVSHHATCFGSFNNGPSKVTFQADVWDYDVGSAMAQCRSTDSASGADQRSTASAPISKAPAAITCSISQPLGEADPSIYADIRVDAARSGAAVYYYNGAAAILGNLTCSADAKKTPPPAAYGPIDAARRL